MSALDKQEGGQHYKLPIQPIEYIVKNGIKYREANVIKYVTRHANKNGAEDIKKAIHYLEMILEDYAQDTPKAVADSPTTPWGEWVEWSGGKCPVVKVFAGKIQAVRRDGLLVGYVNNWSHHGYDSDIIRYRVRK